MRRESVKSPMPVDGNLPAADIAILKKWIDDGFPEGTCGESEEVCTTGNLKPEHTAGESCFG